MYVEEREVEAICESFGMQADAVYAFRSRLGKRVRAIMAELESASDPSIPTRIDKREAAR